MMKMIKTVCAWCGYVVENGDDSYISHTICNTCCKVELNKLQINKYSEN